MKLDNDLPAGVLLEQIGEESIQVVIPPGTLSEATEDQAITQYGGFAWLVRKPNQEGDSSIVLQISKGDDVPWEVGTEQLLFHFSVGCQEIFAIRKPEENRPQS